MRIWLFSTRFWLLIVAALTFLKHGGSSVLEFTTEDLSTVISTRITEITTGDVTTERFPTDATTDLPFFVDDILIVAPTGVCLVTAFWRPPILPDLTFVASSHQPQTSQFGIGKTKVVYLFADMAGIFHCVTFIVEVVPESPIPVNDIMKVVPDGAVSARVNWKGPYFPDLWLVSSSHQPVTSLFDLGVTKVIYVFANMAGEFFCVTFLVEIEPESPLLVDDIVDSAPIGVNYVTVSWIGPFLPGKTLVSRSHQPNTSPFCIGTTKVTYVFVNPATGEFCCVCFYVQIISDAETTERIQTTISSDVETTTSFDEFQDRGLFNDGEWSCENANPCLGSHVTCIDDSTDPYCVCDSGYQFVDSSRWECADINECNRGLHDCEPSAHLICFNEEGGYSCRCLDGFTMTAGGICQIGNSTTDPELERYVPILLAFRTTAINQKPALFSTELLSETSDKFKLLESFTCSSVMEIFSDIPPIPVESCSALGFRSGSIRTFLQLEIALTTLSTDSIRETFMSKLYDDLNGFKVLKRTNGDSLTIEGSSLKFEYIQDISCDDIIVCHNGGVCQVDQKIYQRGCLCPPNFTGSHCETELTNSTLEKTESTLTTQKIDSVPVVTQKGSVVTQERRTSAIFIVIPVAFTACVMFLLMCCCCVSLKHKTNSKSALVKQRRPIDVIQLHRMSWNKSHRKPQVIRNPVAGVNESYEDSELEDERRLKHFERVFTEMRKSGAHSVPSNAPSDRSVSNTRLSEFSHPYTADGSVNF